MVLGGRGVGAKGPGVGARSRRLRLDCDRSMGGVCEWDILSVQVSNSGVLGVNGAVWIENRGMYLAGTVGPSVQVASGD